MDVASAAGWSGSEDEVPADFLRSSSLGRFPALSEARYQSWLVLQTMPLVRIAARLSIAVWILFPVGMSLWLGERAGVGIFVISWAIIVPASAAIMVISDSHREGIKLPAVAVGLVLVAVVTYHLMYAELRSPSPAALLAGIVWYNSLPLYFRAPFRLAVATTTAMTVAGCGYLLAAVDAVGVSRSEGWVYLAFLSITLVMVPVMCVVNENSMRSRYVGEQVIARQRELIRRYAPLSVVSRIEQGDITVGATQRRRVTILFADVVGFTAIADRLDPEALAEIVNDYLGSVADIIERHGGTLNEFAGDGVMAIYGAPDEMETCAQVKAALTAAQELQASLPQWSQRWYRLGIDRDLAARVGINTGVVSVGTFGSAVRATYTGIGLQTNIAARIQAQCPPGSVLLSATSWHHVKDDVPCELRGEVEVKGVHFPIAMYEPSAR